MSDAKLRNSGVVSYHQMQHHHYAMKQSAAAVAECYPVPLDLSQKSSRLKVNANPVNNSNKTNQKMKTNKTSYNNLINTDLKSIINELSNKKLKTTTKRQGSQYQKGDMHNSGLEMNEEMGSTYDDETNEQLENEIYDEYTEEVSSNAEPENFSTDLNINNINYENEDLNDEDSQEFDQPENTDVAPNNDQNMNQQAVHMAAAAAVALMENLISKSNSTNANKMDAPISELSNQEFLKMSNLFKIPNFYSNIYNNNNNTNINSDKNEPKSAAIRQSPPFNNINRNESKKQNQIKAKSLNNNNNTSTNYGEILNETNIQQKKQQQKSLLANYGLTNFLQNPQLDGLLH